jgi:hypothetical protein
VRVASAGELAAAIVEEIDDFPVGDDTVQETEPEMDTLAVPVTET